MEGIGYWLILLVLYLLSAFLKKKKQKKAWKVLDQEDEEPQDSAWKQPEFLKNIFGDMSFGEKDKTGGFEFIEEKTTAKIPPSSPGPSTEKISVPIQEQDYSFKKSEIQTLRHTKAYIMQKGEFNSLIQGLFDRTFNLKQAIVLKEIFDKPKALRGSGKKM